MNKKGYNTVEVIVLIAIFTIGYFITVGVVSKNFKGDFSNDLYIQKIAAIEKQAEIYGEKTEDFFKDGNSVYKTIEELALENIIISNEEGVVVDPRDSEKTLNDLKVRITNNKGKVSAKVLG